MKVAVTELHPDVMPLTVFLAAIVVAKVVLLAQFIGDMRGRCRQIVEAPHNFGAAARVIGDRSQRAFIDVLVAAAPPRTANRREPHLRRVREPAAGKTSANAAGAPLKV